MSRCQHVGSPHKSAGQELAEVQSHHGDARKARVGPEKVEDPLPHPLAALWVGFSDFNVLF